jgi:hypothetical protein
MDLGSGNYGKIKLVDELSGSHSFAGDYEISVNKRETCGYCCFIRYEMNNTREPESEKTESLGSLKRTL